MRNVPASSQDASLRPDQRLAKQRREAAERQALIDSRKRLPFKPIVLLCDKKKRKKAQKPKGKRFCYCYDCLRKYRFKSNQHETKCVDCKTELRQVKTLKAMAGVVTRLKVSRGLKKTRSKILKGGYEEYLRSPLWKQIRNRVLDRDNHVCRDCGGSANHVHHLSYSAPVMEGKDDSKLVSLCVKCHNARHPDKPPMDR